MGLSDHSNADDDEVALENDDDDLGAIGQDLESVQAHVQNRSCSHRPIPPPPFCRLPSESLTAAVLPGHTLPATLPLGDHARCDCGQISRSNAEVRVRTCKVYYSTGTVSKTIETQECDCRGGPEKRSIGPDLMEYGLFNWNNSVIVAHEVFNSYTSQMSTSPTPFTAFCSTIRHSYEQHAPGTSSKFVARTTFIKLYFAFVTLQQLDVSFSCSICGPTPAIVIADGVVLAYSAALKHAELRPPTTPGVSINEKARKGSIVSFLPSAAARAAARQFAVSFDASRSEQVDVLQSFTIAIEASKSIPLSLRLWIGHFKQLMIDISLSDDIPPSFKMGLQQLVLQFSAHDGILQLCRPFCRSTLSSLSSIDITSTSDDHFARLSTTLARHCPFLGNVFVLLAHDRTNLTSSDWVRSLQLLMASTSDAIDYQLALLDPRPTPPPSTIPQQLNYTQTGTLYGAPQCRTRPAYPRLEEGKEGKSGEKQAMQEGVQEGDVQCRKFYDEYVKRQRTGGIMALWCTHCICVGFHVIPQAEGRNDVFSAIFSHWPTPPSVIVYDFACQLGPYSLRREPGFFQDTLFVVDQMHEKGHTNCSAASRLSTYMRNDPQLQHLYSSAAECGNAGLSRIKKTVSYCKQEHAVALVRVFLSIWNRNRKRG